MNWATTILVFLLTLGISAPGCPCVLGCDLNDPLEISDCCSRHSEDGQGEQPVPCSESCCQQIGSLKAEAHFNAPNRPADWEPITSDLAFMTGSTLVPPSHDVATLPLPHLRQAGHGNRAILGVFRI